jgi:hypothetical protein
MTQNPPPRASPFPDPDEEIVVSPYEEVIVEGKTVGIRLKGYTAPAHDLATHRYGNGISYTAQAVTSRDAPMQASIYFDSLEELNRLSDAIEEGIDLCGLFAKTFEGATGTSWTFVETRSARLRADGPEVFVEIGRGKKKERRVARPFLGASELVRVPKGERRKPNWHSTPGKYEEMTMADFIRTRERRRAREEAALIPNRSDHLSRALVSKAGRADHIGKIEELAKERAKAYDLEWISVGKIQDANLQVRREKRITIDPSKAYELAVGLTPDSRSLAAHGESPRKRKTSVTVEGTVQAIFPFEQERVTIEGNTDPRRVAETVERTFLASLYKALSEKTLQVFLAIFDEAYQRGGSYLLDRNMIARKMGIDLRAADYSGKALADLDATLEDLERFVFMLEVRQGGDAIGLKAPILQWEYTKTRQNTRGEKSESKTWRVSDKVIQWLHKARALALVDRSVFLLDAKKDSWEIRFLLFIASKWSKGWLGDERLCKKDGAFAVQTQSLLHSAGLMLAAQGMLRDHGRPSLRTKVREVLENLRRCGPHRVEAIGDYTLEPDPIHPDDPLLDRISITPSKGQIERFRDEILGRAEQKMFDNTSAPKSSRRRAAARPRRA